MDHIELPARAKINLALDITGKRSDGYHDMRMIMQSVALCDYISIRLTGKPGGIEVRTNLRWLPADERNLAYKAAMLITEKFAVDGQLECEVGRGGIRNDVKEEDDAENRGGIVERRNAEPPFAEYKLDKIRKKRHRAPKSTSFLDLLLHIPFHVVKAD